MFIFDAATSLEKLAQHINRIVLLLTTQKSVNFVSHDVYAGGLSIQLKNPETLGMTNEVQTCI